MLLVGALGMLALQVLLLVGAYMLLSATFPDPGPDIARREFLGCKLWYHGAGALGGGGD